MASFFVLVFAFALAASRVGVSLADDAPETPPAVLPLDGSAERTDAASTLQLRKTSAPYSYYHPLAHYGPQPEEPLEHFAGHRLEGEKDVGFSNKDIAMAFLAYIGVLSILQGSLFSLTSTTVPFARRRGRREVSGMEAVVGGGGGESQWRSSGSNPEEAFEETGVASRGRRKRQRRLR